MHSFYFELSDERARDCLAEILATPTLIFHNAKFDMRFLIRHNVLDRASLHRRFHDTECMMQLIDEHQKKDLKTLAVEILGIKNTIEVPYKSGAKKGQLHTVEKESYRLGEVRRELGLTKADGYDKLPREVLIPYALSDVVHTLGLYHRLWPQLEQRDLYEDELELVLAVMDMEDAGMAVDLPYVSKAIRDTNTEILRAEKLIEGLTGLSVWYPEKSGQTTPEGHINPQSPAQLIAAFAERGLSISSTKNDVLKPIRDDLAAAILGLREHKKLRDYLYAIEELNQGGVMHPNFKLFKPRTGRTSSGKEEE